jgi:hypothetical protein
MDMGFMDKDEITIFLIDQLGGSSRGYGRDRKRAYREIVSEVFSPPRVTAHLSRFPNKDLLPGFALDFTCTDPFDGLPWDFDKPSKRKRALAMQREEKPLFLIGSPVCTAWCSWQALNNTKRDPDVVRREKLRSLVHLKFVEEMYREQMENGRYLLHEHPEWATSWAASPMAGLLKDERVKRVRADQCMYGAKVQFGELLGKPILKPTGFMSNAHELLEELTRRCSRAHEHAVCTGRIARDAARYPEGLLSRNHQGHDQPDEGRRQDD